MEVVATSRGTLWLLSRNRWGDLAYKFRKPTLPPITDKGALESARCGSASVDARRPASLQESPLTEGQKSAVLASIRRSFVFATFNLAQQQRMVEIGEVLSRHRAGW